MQLFCEFVHPPEGDFAICQCQNEAAGNLGAKKKTRLVLQGITGGNFSSVKTMSGFNNLQKVSVVDSSEASCFFFSRLL